MSSTTPTPLIVRPGEDCVLSITADTGPNAPWTYWDYGPAFEANRGLRIDHALLSAELAERLTGATVDLAARSEESPSDHAPVLFDLAD